jgi:outer membrane receptor protein involved in Fe transport
MSRYLPNLSKLAAGLLLLLSGSPLVSAQQVASSATATGDDEAIELEAFTVTGSNLRRIENENSLPVTRLDLEVIEVRDASQAADLLAGLPQVTGLPGNETATLGATARGDNSSVALRGIASSNTLLLLNGRRLVPHGISQSEAGVPTLSVNSNQLPNQGLERVEVLRDGASSIYGTDAVAGVINYITQRRFKGTELRLRFAETEIGDGREIRGTLTHGIDFADGRGRGVFVLDVYEREEILARNRDFMVEADHSARAPEPWNVPTNTSFNARSATSEFGNYELGTINASGAFVPGRRPGVPSSLVATSGRFFLVPTANGVGFQTSTPSRAGVTRTYYWNNNTYRVLQPDSNRVNAFFNGEYDLTTRLTGFAELSLYRARSLTFREPDGITQSTDGNIVVPIDNPWNPFGSRFWHPAGEPNADGTPRLTGTPGVVRISNKRLTDLQDRTATIDNRILRGVAGLRGKFGETWTWESAVLRSESRVEDAESGPSRKSLLIEAINQTDPARAFNPFTRTFAVQGNTLVVTGDYRNPESVQETFRSSFVREGRTGLSSIDFGASGDLFELWGGNRAGLAFGGEYRYETYSDVRPPFAGLNPPGSGLDPESNDFLGFSPNSDTDGNRHVAALYAETVIPLVGGAFQLPLVQSLEVSASARFESYTDFGETTKPKFGLTWRPASWMLVRASYNEGFKAPNLAQLFTGTLIRTSTGSNDTYRSPVTGLPNDGPSNRRNIASGNPDLQPEESTGKSAGVVFDIPLVKGLSLGVDYWEIRQKDVIAVSGSIADDTAALLAATAAGLAAGQSIDQIDLGSGTAAYQGDPSVVRLPVTQTDRDFFAAYNAGRAPGNQRAVVGGIDVLRSTYFNRAQQFVNGFDLDATYRLPETRVGSFTLATAWTYLNDFHAYNSAGASRTELRWTNAAAVAGASTKWRGNASLTWRKQAWRAGLSAYYVGDYSDSGATTTAATYDSLGQPAWIAPVQTNGTTVYRHVVRDSINYNAHVSYSFRNRENAWLNNTTIRLGVINLFDRIPPLSSDSRGYDPSLYNQMARGRSWNIQLTKRL